MKLNPDQNKALIEIFEFLSSERNFHILSGCAGSGKTTLIRSILESLSNIVVHTAALTHKAAKVLESYTGKCTTTLHKALGVKMEETPKGLKPVFPTFPRIHRNQSVVIVVDEVSMMDKVLWNYIKETYSGSKTKWILVGDRNQLPGVGSKVPVFFSGIPESHLRVGMRQPKRILELLCKHLQECVVHGNKPDLEKFASKDVLFVDSKNPEEYLKSFEPDQDMLLAYSNKGAVNLIWEYKKYMGQGTMYEPGERVYALRRVESAFDNYIINTDEEFVLIQEEEIIENNMSIWEIQNEDSKRYIYAERWITATAYENEFPFMRPFYGRTVHKAQGSTYRNVYVDLNSFTKANTQDMCNRLLYIAASRPKNAVYFIDKLPKRLRAS